jgi:serine/arginine repetitive matrix protein 2
MKVFIVTIRSIVNGLRDDDIDSAYPSRASFASEYSGQDGNNEPVQVRFKQHGRSGSVGSASSFNRSKKQVSGNVRPETKVGIRGVLV